MRAPESIHDPISHILCNTPTCQSPSKQAPSYRPLSARRHPIRPPPSIRRRLPPPPRAPKPPRQHVPALAFRIAAPQPGGLRRRVAVAHARAPPPPIPRPPLRRHRCRVLFQRLLDRVRRLALAFPVAGQVRLCGGDGLAVGRGVERAQGLAGAGAGRLTWPGMRLKPASAIRSAPSS